MQMVGRLLLGADRQVIEVMKPLFPAGLIEHYRLCIGLVADEQIAGGVLLFGLRPGIEIEFCMGAVTPRAFTRGTIRELAAFTFATFGVQRITAETAKSNKRARKGLERAGFVLEGMKRRAMPKGEPAMIYGLLPGELKL